MSMIKNEVVLSSRHNLLLLLVALPLLVVPWWKSRALFDRLFCGWPSFSVYSGSRHFALLNNNCQIFRVKDKDYC